MDSSICVMLSYTIVEGRSTFVVVNEILKMAEGGQLPEVELLITTLELSRVTGLTHLVAAHPGNDCSCLEHDFHFKSNTCLMIKLRLQHTSPFSALSCRQRIHHLPILPVQSRFRFFLFTLDSAHPNVKMYIASAAAPWSEI